jgi:hypothetical protein
LHSPKTDFVLNRHDMGADICRGNDVLMESMEYGQSCSVKRLVIEDDKVCVQGIAKGMREDLVGRQFRFPRRERVLPKQDNDGW